MRVFVCFTVVISNVLNTNSLNLAARYRGHSMTFDSRNCDNTFMLDIFLQRERYLI